MTHLKQSAYEYFRNWLKNCIRYFYSMARHKLDQFDLTCSVALVSLIETNFRSVLFWDFSDRCEVISSYNYIDGKSVYYLRALWVIKI